MGQGESREAYMDRFAGKSSETKPVDASKASEGEQAIAPNNHVVAEHAEESCQPL